MCTDWETFPPKPSTIPSPGEQNSSFSILASRSLCKMQRQAVLKEAPDGKAQPDASPIGGCHSSVHGSLHISMGPSTHGSPPPLHCRVWGSAALPALLATLAFELLLPTCSTTGEKKITINPKPLCGARPVVTGLRSSPLVQKTPAKPTPVGSSR